MRVYLVLAGAWLLTGAAIYATKGGQKEEGSCCLLIVVLGVLWGGTVWWLARAAR